MSMGDEVLGAPGSFSTWNEWDKITFIQQLDKTGERHRRQEKLQQVATVLTIKIKHITEEAKGDNDE